MGNWKSLFYFVNTFNSLIFPNEIASSANSKQHNLVFPIFLSLN